MNTKTTITEFDRDFSTPASAYHLLLMSPNAFAVHPLPVSGTLTIGRSKTVEVQLEDPAVSREHARLHVVTGATGLSLTVEDASSNGTRVRETVLKNGERVAIQVGEAFMMGSTVLMVLPHAAAAGPRRLWSHAYFEERVEEACAQASDVGGGDTTFALVRVRFAGAAPWFKVMPIMARDLTGAHVVASYGPCDYEILLLGVNEAEEARAIQGLTRACEDAGLSARFAVAWYPRDGRNVDTLLATANASLKTGAEQPSVAPPAATAPMQRVRDMAAKVAASPINVLILGERGVGKDVLARLIHQQSPRAERPFVAFNCAALAEGVLESELFGHERGAFSGAIGTSAGLLASANGGTVFLDEIGELAPKAQAALLRAIDNREIRAVGSPKVRNIDVRFIAATNRNLDGAIASGDFRADLLDRLSAVTLTVPPLRERTDEIPALVATFAAAARREMGRETSLSVSGDVMAHLLRYRWPGNIRELKNVIDRAVALCDGPEIHPAHLPLEKMVPAVANVVVLQPAARPSATSDVTQPLRELNNPLEVAERQKIIDALAACNGNQTRAAELINMPRRTFVAKLDYYGLPRPQKALRTEGPP